MVISCVAYAIMSRIQGKFRFILNGSPIWAPFTVKYDTDKREVSHLFWRFLELSGMPGEKDISDDENQTGRVK
ncbi:hypothetical protein HUJ05_002178 [Dendroctonus ponderosae]|nr:hypothetical protein HUJ05_002178 [Dendroctonus ponderosae]